MKLALDDELKNEIDKYAELMGFKGRNKTLVRSEILIQSCKYVLENDKEYQDRKAGKANRNVLDAVNKVNNKPNNNK
jgi:hypothetical protein